MFPDKAMNSFVSMMATPLMMLLANIYFVDWMGSLALASWARVI